MLHLIRKLSLDNLAGRVISFLYKLLVSAGDLWSFPKYNSYIFFFHILEDNPFLEFIFLEMLIPQIFTFIHSVFFYAEQIITNKKLKYQFFQKKKTTFKWSSSIFLKIIELKVVFFNCLL